MRSGVGRARTTWFWIATSWSCPCSMKIGASSCTQPWNSPSPSSIARSGEWGLAQLGSRRALQKVFHSLSRCFVSSWVWLPAHTVLIVAYAQDALSSSLYTLTRQTDLRTCCFFTPELQQHVRNTCMHRAKLRSGETSTDEFVTDSNQYDMPHPALWRHLWWWSTAPNGRRRRVDAKT